MAPLTGEVLDNSQHARRQHIAALGQNGWQLGAQEASPFPGVFPRRVRQGASALRPPGNRPEPGKEPGGTMPWLGNAFD